MKNIAAIFQKQIKDTLKNQSVLIQFVMFPVMALIMERAMHMEDLPAHFFANLFAAMYIGMAPLVGMSAIISEEKEKNTLRVLMMANVKPAEYLIGVGSYIWIACMLGSLVIGLGTGYGGKLLFTFLLIMAAGILTSLVIGAAIGTWSRSQMMATSLMVPVMCIFSFLPMLSMFNETIEKMARITYSQQISLLIGSMPDIHLKFENGGIIFLNALIAVILFVAAYRKSGLA